MRIKEKIEVKEKEKKERKKRDRCALFTFCGSHI